MTHDYDNPDLPYRLVKHGDDWEIQCSGIGSVVVKDRSLANGIFQLVHRAYSCGRAGAFTELRRLIGA